MPAPQAPPWWWPRGRGASYTSKVSGTAFLPGAAEERCRGNGGVHRPAQQLSEDVELEGHAAETVSPDTPAALGVWERQESDHATWGKMSPETAPRIPRFCGLRHPRFVLYLAHSITRNPRRMFMKTHA